MQKKLAPTLLFLLWISPCALADDQHWLDTSVTWKQTDATAILFTTQNKYRAWDQSGGLSSKNWVLGYQWKLANGFSLALNYKQELKRKPDNLDVVERRPFVDLGWKRGLTDRSSFDFRLRLEANHYIQDTVRDRYTARFRFRIKGRARLAGVSMEPYLAVEPYYDTYNDTFNKYRIYAGATIPIRAHIKLKLGYIRQDARGKAPNNVLNTGVSIVF